MKGKLDFRKNLVDSNDRIIESYSYNKDSIIEFRKFIYVNKRNRKKVLYIYNKDSSIYSKYTTKYNFKGYITSEKVWSNGDFDNKTSYKFRKQHRKVVYKAYNNRRLDQKIINKFDENYDLTELISIYYSDRIKHQKRYRNKYLSYDKSGNWISMLEFKNEKANILIERVIEYY